jgi:hypothetical protein
MKRLSLLLIPAVLLLALGMVLGRMPEAVSAQGSAQENAPVHLTFDKSSVEPGIWEGTVAGDVEGNLTTELRDLRVNGPIWHVEFDWIIDAGDQSFTARLTGVLNTNTGRVVMNGAVIEGWLEGARVHEEGQLIDPDTLRFQGAILLMPATAD